MDYDMGIKIIERMNEEYCILNKGLKKLNEKGKNEKKNYRI